MRSLLEEAKKIVKRKNIWDHTFYISQLFGANKEKAERLANSLASLYDKRGKEND